MVIDKQKYLSDVLLDVGLSAIGKIDTNLAYGFIVRPVSQFAQVFLPHIVSIKSQYILTGILGIVQQDLLRSSKRNNFVGDLLLSCHSSNFTTLTQSEEFAVSRYRDREWCNLMAGILHAFPVDEGALHVMLQDGAYIGGVQVSKMIYQQLH